MPAFPLGRNSGGSPESEAWEAPRRCTSRRHWSDWRPTTPAVARWKGTWCSLPSVRPSGSSAGFSGWSGSARPWWPFRSGLPLPVVFAVGEEIQLVLEERNRAPRLRADAVEVITRPLGRDPVHNRLLVGRVVVPVLVVPVHFAVIRA